MAPVQCPSWPRIPQPIHMAKAGIRKNKGLFVFLLSMDVNSLIRNSWLADAT